MVGAKKKSLNSGMVFRKEMGLVWGFFWVFFFSFLFTAILHHREVPRPGVKSELQPHNYSDMESKPPLQPTPYLKAMSDP